MTILDRKWPLAGIFMEEIVMRPGPGGALADDIEDFHQNIRDVLRQVEG